MMESDEGGMKDIHDDVLPADNPHRYLFSDPPVEPETSHMTGFNHSEPHYYPPGVPTLPIEDPAVISLEHEKRAQPKPKPNRPPPTANGASRQASYDQRFKNTVDYHLLMTATMKLKEQREQAVTDLKKLQAEHTKSIQDPHTFVNSLLSKEDIIPRRQKVEEVPEVNFDIYESLPLQTEHTPKPGDPIRGRKYQSSKPASFNLPWTFEEQQRLERLLIEYPDEPVAVYRWERIARALGNRTPKQVGSRVQKYFQKLAEAGLPVPGRVPTIQPKDRNQLTAVGKDTSTTSVVYTKHINYLEAPAVKMPAIQTINDDDLLDPEEKQLFVGLHHTPEYKELIRLKKLKFFQQQAHENYVQQETTGATQVHHGSTCSSCAVSPIVGNLYICIDCPTRIELCSSCQQAGIWSNGSHLASHHLELERTSGFVDADYAITDEMDYLDPNYFKDY